MRNSKMVKYYFLGRGAISNLQDLLNNKKAGAKDAFVVMVIDHYFENKNIIDLSYLSDEDLIIYAQTDEEPKTSYVDQLVDLARSKGRLPVAIVGIGGGSAMDIAKAISVLLTNPGPSENYQGWDLVKNPAIYKIGVPTIAGTGAASGAASEPASGAETGAPTGAAASSPSNGCGAAWRALTSWLIASRSVGGAATACGGGAGLADTTAAVGAAEGAAEGLGGWWTRLFHPGSGPRESALNDAFTPNFFRYATMLSARSMLKR